VATFGLVHGAWHGSWCWEKLVPQLEERGHRAVTPDLPCDDPSAGAGRYAEVVEQALGQADDVILVGHSLGGITIPIVASRRPVRHLVYLCAVIPHPGRSLGDWVPEERDVFSPGFGSGVTEQRGDCSYWVDVDLARQFFYADCDPDDATAAFHRLRGQSGGPWAERCPLDAFPPDVPATYIVCSEDAAINPEWSRATGAPRAGARLVEMSGSHSPFVAQPAALAEVLTAL
jgi:pimeloyl-ACP methyl ester carboxylesterase